MEWSFAEVLGFVVVYFLLLLVIGSMGICLSLSSAPHKFALGFYGFVLMAVIAIPMWVQNGALAAVAYTSKADL